VEALEGGQAAMRTQLETLRVVPAWPKPADPSEILKSDAMRKFIRQSASNYDLILIDAPALSEHEDVELLTEFADAVAFVVDAANATGQAARDLLNAIELPSIGMIVNTLPATTEVHRPVRQSRYAAKRRGSDLVHETESLAVSDPESVEDEAEVEIGPVPQ
ncbi:MAG: hypothetical protein JXA69_17175, partial [Phycisphaerae bacterium]|nr:hypothetical protein [Phycisphaerae bacterium]